MRNFIPFFTPSMGWSKLLLAACALGGCDPVTAPAPAARQVPDALQPAAAKAPGPAPARPPDPTGENQSLPAAVTAPVAEPAALPAAVPAAVPVAAAERLWDSCSSQDPNPWSWRDATEGKWGENPLVVPHFTFAQERRAPKMPDADRYLRLVGPSRSQGVRDNALKDALLICHVETYSRHGRPPALYKYKLQRPNPARHNCGLDWDPFNGPDVLLRFGFRDDYPIALFGPEDHWGFFVSIPHIALAVGDSLSVKLWDRDSGTFYNGYINDRKNEYMGQAALKFDGTLPFTLRSEYFTLRCNAMKAAQTRALAHSWLTQLDQTLRAAADWRPDPNRWNFGQTSLAQEAESEFGRGIFRYPAGFLGWDDPEIQSRLTLLGGLAAQAAGKRRERTAELYQRVPSAASGTHRLDGNRGAIRFEAASCDGDRCEVWAQVGARLLQDLCASLSDKPILRAGGIDQSGKFAYANTLIEQDGAWRYCHSETLAANSGTKAVHLQLPRDAVLLWLGGVGKAAIFTLPAPAP